MKKSQKIGADWREISAKDRKPNKEEDQQKVFLFFFFSPPPFLDLGKILQPKAFYPKFGHNTNLVESGRCHENKTRGDNTNAVTLQNKKMTKDMVVFPNFAKKILTYLEFSIYAFLESLHSALEVGIRNISLQKTSAYHFSV